MSRRLENKRRLAVVAAVGVLGIGVTVPTMALAGENKPTPTGSSSEGNGRNHHRTELVEALAKELGLPADQVAAALEKVHEQHRSDRRDPSHRRLKGSERLAERLARAVAGGKLTQEQADAITKAFEAGLLPGLGGRDHRGKHRHHGKRGDHGEHRPAGTDHGDK
ncbi:MAG TPA: hypothetical protein VFX60_09600 [Micromonospora sp.]|nr:hypothetical protein [Micromonospora sp.]